MLYRKDAEYNADGTVNVLSPYFMEGAPVSYEHVELLYIGTNAGCIAFNPEGCLCLLLKPYACIPDTTSMQIDNRESPHSNAGMKAIPITNGRQTALKTMFDGYGNFKNITNIDINSIINNIVYDLDKENPQEVYEL